MHMHMLMHIPQGLVWRPTAEEEEAVPSLHAVPSFSCVQCTHRSVNDPCIVYMAQAWMNPQALLVMAERHYAYSRVIEARVFDTLHKRVGVHTPQLARAHIASAHI